MDTENELLLRLLSFRIVDTHMNQGNHNRSEKSHFPSSPSFLSFHMYSLALEYIESASSLSSIFCVELVRTYVSSSTDCSVSVILFLSLKYSGFVRT